MIILGLDPGTTSTGVVIYDCVKAIVTYAAGEMDNEQVRDGLLDDVWVEQHGVGRFVIETMSPRGMRLGQDTMRTIRWTGRLEELCYQSLGRVEVIERDTIKLTLLGRTNVKGADSLIRQLLLDEVGPKGTKKNPGPTFGVSKHAWQALGAVWAHLYQLREGAHAA